MKLRELIETAYLNKIKYLFIRNCHIILCPYDICVYLHAERTIIVDGGNYHNYVDSRLFQDIIKSVKREAKILSFLN